MVINVGENFFHFPFTRHSRKPRGASRKSRKNLKENSHIGGRIKSVKMKRERGIPMPSTASGKL